jgi:hypothetical protein
MDEDQTSEAEIRALIRQLSSDIGAAHKAGMDAALKAHNVRNAVVVSSIESHWGTATISKVSQRPHYFSVLATSNTQRLRHFNPRLHVEAPREHFLKCRLSQVK